jgi:hypothetical protein
MAAFFQQFRWGNTHCQPHCRSALRFFLAKAFASITAPLPAAIHLRAAHLARMA